MATTTSKDQIDHDALAAEWGVALEAEQNSPAAAGAAPADGPSAAEAMASQWATMADDSQFAQGGGNTKGGAERVLTLD